MPSPTSRSSHGDGSSSSSSSGAGRTEATATTSSSEESASSLSEPTTTQTTRTPTPPQATVLRRRGTALERMTSDETAQRLQRRATQLRRHPSVVAGVAGRHAMDLEWEEWDGQSPFYYHCVAGSVAGISEHILLYPVDTLKTALQSHCAVDCPKKANAGGGMFGALRHLHHSVATSAGTGAAAGGAAAATAAGSPNTAPIPLTAATFRRLWRGAQVMAIGCVPAHALYFSSYEAVKLLFSGRNSTSRQQPTTTQNLGPVGSAAAGATAAFCHDVVMTPVDTIKQRLQLGHYRGMTDAVRSMVRQEGGAAGLYRAFPVTLATNLPYGAVMVATNEYLREVLAAARRRDDHNYGAGEHGTTAPAAVLDVPTTMAAGCGAGAVAAAVTTPLDRCKTRLQTQGLGMVAACGYAGGTHPESCIAAAPGGRRGRRQRRRRAPKYAGMADAFSTILREEGWAGLFRGLAPRLLTHTPAVAISWTTYEACKHWLLSSSGY